MGRIDVICARFLSVVCAVFGIRKLFTISVDVWIETEYVYVQRGICIR